MKKWSVILILITVLSSACLAENFQDRIDRVVPQPGDNFSLENVLFGICGLGDENFNAAWCGKFIDEVVNGLRDKTAGMPTDKKIGAINQCLFEELGIKYDYTACDAVLNSYLTCEYTYKTIENLLRDRRGICSQITMLYLIIGDRLDIPLKSVVLPGHIFVRLDDGNKSVNIDVTSRGRIFTDKYYEREFGRPVRNLVNSRYSTVGYYLRDLGSYYRDARQYDKAVMLLNKAVAINPDDLLGKFELISCYEKSGKLLSSFNTYNRMIQDVIESKKTSEIKEMAGYFEAAVKKDRDNLYYNYTLGILYLHMPGKRKKAIEALNRVLLIEPGYRDVRKILRSM